MLSMALYLRDARASQEQGRNIFRIPYPGNNWREEKENNSLLIYLMGRAWDTASLGLKVSNNMELTKEENRLLDEISELMD